ncbi:hypothetical protein FISHEDRAFT_48008, partial [Fistulina hepatica ATCC 64428]
GCAYLRAVQSQMRSGLSTEGEYLEVICLHRAMLAAYPAAHAECAEGICDMAGELEQRARQVGVAVDGYAAVFAFLHEARSVNEYLSQWIKTSAHPYFS